MSEASISEFVSSNSGFLLTLLGISAGMCGGLLGCILKSRCSRIKCFCIELERDVLNLETVDPQNVRIDTNNGPT